MIRSAFLACVILGASLTACGPGSGEPLFYDGNHEYLVYTGRVDRTGSELPRFWNAGVYIQAWFEGKTCELTLNDEVLWGNYHNYVSIVIDDMPVRRIKLTEAENKIDLSEGLDRGKHKITVCKSTEALVGYLEFGGIRCEKLLKPGDLPERKMEFYGNSITCGFGANMEENPCDSMDWYDQHDAWMSYGPLTARNLDASWMLTSESGIGLMHSCCGKETIMPEVYDRVCISENKIGWDFSAYTPDVVTICLGQNDGIQDSTEFCSAYVDFILELRSRYPDANIVCLTSPMANADLDAVLRVYIDAVVGRMNSAGDEKVSGYAFSRQYHNGCGEHPDLVEQAEIAGELTGYLHSLMGW